MRMNRLIFILISCFILVQSAHADTIPPKVPNPFCSPSDFFNYLNQKNHERVLYVVQNCTNIDLNEKGPKGETFAAALATTTWNDVFELSLNRSDADFQPVTTLLITNKKFDWLKKLATKETIKFGLKDRAEIANTFPASKEFLLQLVELKKIDLNQTSTTTGTDTMLFAALYAQKLDLVQFLRTIPEVTQRDFYAHACSLQNSSNRPEILEIYRQYFKALFTNENIDINLTCSNGSSLAVNLLTPAIDKELRTSVLTHPALDLSKPSQSFKIVQALVANFSTHGDNFFAATLGNPTFNLADKNTDNQTLWHLLVNTRSAELNKTTFYKYFENLSEETINVPDNRNYSPLYYYLQKARTTDSFSKRFLGSSKLEINRIDGKVTALVNALLAQNSEMFSFLLERGADKIKVGDLKSVHNLILYAMSRNKLYFDTFFNHPDIEINNAITINGSKNLPIFGFIMADGSNSFMADFIPRIIADSRFDGKQIETFRKTISDYNRTTCTASQIWIMSNINDQKTLLKLIEKSSDENLNNICANNTLMGIAAKNGNLEMVDHLFSVRKLPVTGFVAACASRNWNIVEYFLGKGYKPEYNSEYINAILSSEKYDLLKKFVTDPTFDPNKNIDDHGTNLLLKVANEKGKEIFDLIMSNPKTQVGERLISLMNWYSGEEKPNYFFETAFSKFTITSDAGKIDAIRVAARLARLDYPVSYLDRLIKVKNFDVNFIVPKGADNYDSESYTLYAYLMAEVNAAYIDSLFKIKTFNPNTVADRMPINELLFSEAGKVEFAVLKKYFDAHYGHPTVKIVMPKMLEKPLIDYLAEYNAQNDSKNFYKPLRIAALYLSNQKFKFTKEEMAKFFTIRKFIKAGWNSVGNYDFAYLNAFFTNAAAKPLVQWSSIIESLKIDSERDTNEINFILKFGHELDLNFVSASFRESLLYSSVDDDIKVLFDYLITNPKVSIVGILSKSLSSWRNRDHYVKVLLEKRGKEIPQKDFLNEFVHYTTRTIKDDKLPDDILPEIKIIFPYIKSFDQITGMSSTSYNAPLAFFEKWKGADEIMPLIYNRIIKEDSTIAKNAKGVIVPAIVRGQYDLVELLIRKGYDLTTPVDDKSIMVQITAQKSLTGLKFLASKGQDAQTECAGSWSCRGDEIPFGVAMNLGWYEGADYLITLKANPNYQDNSNSSSMLAAVTKKDLIAVQYLLSKKVHHNATGSLVKAIMDQSDEILEIFLNDESTDPNSRGIDVTMKRETYPIIEAARYGRVDYVSALLMFPKINKVIKDSLGYRAIDWAATNNFQEIVELLKK